MNIRRYCYRLVQYQYGTNNYTDIRSYQIPYHEHQIQNNSGILFEIYVRKFHLNSNEHFFREMP